MSETHVLTGLAADVQEDSIRGRARAFAQTVVAPNATRYDEEGSFHWDIYRRFAGSGLLPMGLPPDMGGTSGSTRAIIAVLEELASADVSTAVTYAAMIELAGGSIVLGGSAAQRDYWLPQLANGELLATYAIAEPGSGSDLRAMRTIAKKDNDGWVLSGEKSYVTNYIPGMDGVVMVLAKLESDSRDAPIGAFVVSYRSEGLSSTGPISKTVWRGTTTYDLFFDQCHVPSNALLGEQEDGWERGGSRVTVLGRIGMAAIAVGAAWSAYEEALGYAHERVQFGRRLIDFQNTRMRLAEHRTDIEAARLMMFQAADTRDAALRNGPGIEHVDKQDPDLQKAVPLQAHMAKLYATEMCGRVSDGAVQILGARALKTESTCGRVLRDQRMFRIGQGTSEIEKLIIANEIISQKERKP